jgi:hypothetical protein
MTSSSQQPSLDQPVDRRGDAPSEHRMKSWLRIVEVGLGEVLLADRGERQSPPRGALFAAVISSRTGTTAVAIVGRPVPPARDDGFTLEITRIRTGGSVSAEVAIYRAVWQLILLRGYRRLITHTEMGAIRRGLTALGLTPVAAVPPRAGAHVPPRLRVGRGVDGACRVRWELTPGHHRHPAQGYTSIARAIPLAGETDATDATRLRRAA